MARFDPRLMSEPAEVIFAGFRSDTRSLQQAGWQLSMNQDIYGHRIQLAMHHPGAGLYMLADEVRYHFIDSGRESSFQQSYPQPIRFIIRHCSSKIMVQVMMDFAQFRPIDAEPQYITSERKTIEDFKIFASPLVRTEEIIIEPQSVAECLDLIRKMQSPELAAIRKRNAQRDREQPINQQNFHAQVISLAA